MFKIKHFPSEFQDPKNTSLLSGILRGVEREALRTDTQGKLAQTPHPTALGSALTNPQITTDFSESLLEFITPPTHRVEDLFAHLETIHNFTHKNLADEIMWSSSMPCQLGDDASIPIAQYGNSNNGKMKTTYRVGLGHRYGRAMQTVAGVHYNFSIPDAVWALLRQKENKLCDLREFKNQKYFDLIRNFRRHYWLLIYLFGASPALCKSFVNNKSHNLQILDDEHTLYLPHATSLRMGDLGYQSKTQESLYVCYNDINSYIKSLCCAITTPHDAYQAIGLKDDQQDYKQLNTSILQIENEFYSAIRPKRTAQPGETALAALRSRGVEYIEVRCLDINPSSPLGITPEQVRFLDTFLLYCALQTSPPTDMAEAAIVLANQKRVVNQGREPNLTLQHPQFGSMPLREWGEQLLAAMRPVALLLDEAKNTKAHQAALNNQQKKMTDPSHTPSAQVLQTLKSNQLSFAQYALSLAKQHKAYFIDQPLNDDISSRMEAMATESLMEQVSLERESTQSFDEFIEQYYSQYQKCSSSTT